MTKFSKTDPLKAHPTYENASYDEGNSKTLNEVQQHKNLNPGIPLFFTYIQRLDQVPTVLVPTPEGPQPLQKQLQEEWNGAFETYVIKPGKGKVSGTLWKLDPKDRELIKDRERVGFWYQEIKVKLKTENGKEVEAVSECLRDNQAINRQVDGLDYKPFLLSRETFKIKTEDARQGHFKRKRLKKQT